MGVKMGERPKSQHRSLTLITSSPSITRSWNRSGTISLVKIWNLVQRHPVSATMRRRPVRLSQAQLTPISATITAPPHPDSSPCPECTARRRSGTGRGRRTTVRGSRLPLSDRVVIEYPHSKRRHVRSGPCNATGLLDHPPRGLQLGQIAFAQWARLKRLPRLNHSGFIFHPTAPFHPESRRVRHRLSGTHLRTPTLPCHP